MLPTARREYKKDKATATKSESDVAVIVMDVSQSLTIPSVTSTPSHWYFCLPLAVNVFGIFYENESTQNNYLYDEFSSGKGSDQINSMLCFKSYKPLVTKLYRLLLGVQQYQIFTMECSSPGVVQCKKGPDDEPVKQDLRRLVDGDKVGRMLTHFLENLSHPPQYCDDAPFTQQNKIRKYVPDEFQEDAIYAAPRVSEEEDANGAKQPRREHRAAMAKAAEQNSDRRAASANEADEASKTMKPA
ncbi:unnamed protein product [Phytophthora fragariaefolia]|uniref:Unnamed protein product n=1 Tax=Phytophthora fragariaefolia TaxID=1490495 RepID=A0A9W6U3U4_9STRA|nr:unnamed protein product [Phytophthora fragariaefolia]